LRKEGTDGSDSPLERGRGVFLCHFDLKRTRRLSEAKSGFQSVKGLLTHQIDNSENVELVDSPFIKGAGGFDARTASVNSRNYTPLTPLSRGEFAKCSFLILIHLMFLIMLSK